MRNCIKGIAATAFLLLAIAMIPSEAKALSAPTNLKQTKAEETALMFQWDAVANADAYCIAWSTDQLNWTDSANYNRKTEYIATELEAGKSYYAKVRSVDKKGTNNDSSDDVYSAWSAPIEVITTPAIRAVRPIQTTVTDSTVTIMWNATEGATSYLIKQKDGSLLGTSTSTSYTVGNLLPQQNQWFFLTVSRKSESGFVAESSACNVIATTGAPVAKPGKPSKKSFGVYTCSAKDGTVKFKATKWKGKAKGYEVQVCDMKKNICKTISSSQSISGLEKFSQNTPYKYRIRYYNVKGDGTKVYGAYSPYRHFLLHKVSGARVYNLVKANCKLNLKWGSVPGAKNYSVYVSKKKGSKYKKVKTFRKNKITIRKYGKTRLKKKQTYYVKIVAKILNGKKAIKNDAQTVSCSKGVR